MDSAVLNALVLQKMNETGAINRLDARVSALQGALAWGTVQSIVKSGKAQSIFNIGDRFTTTATFDGTAYEYPWAIVSFDNVINESGESVYGITLQALYATPYGVQFDAAEPSNSNENIQKYGYNRWSQSAYRQWLNSSKGVNEWWTAQSSTDVAPNELSTKPGFMAAFESDFLSVLGKTQVKTVTNTVTDGGKTDTTYDTFWLPSVEQMYGVPQVSGAEGSYFPYIKTKTGLTSPTNAAVGLRKIYGIDNKATAQTCRLRSAYRDYSFSMWLLYGSTGELTYSYASNSGRCAPCCVIC